MEKAIGYVRVSTEEQSREGVSLEAQQERIRAYATLRGLELTHIFREEGISGKVPLRQRPEGAKLVQELTKKRTQHLLTLKLDRLFRSAEDALGQAKQWDKNKVALHIIDMGGSTIDTASAMGKMFFTMMAGFAEMERNLISERTKTALAHKKSSCRVYTRITPLGFERRGDQLIAQEKEMNTVRSIVEMRSSLSLHAIADSLNQSGAPTKLGGKWYAVTIQNVLKVHKVTQAQCA
jgi:site-specific DNA recombinase